MKKMRKAAFEFSMSTAVIIIIAVVALGLGIILAKNIAKTAQELPAPFFKKSPMQFFHISSSPERGQIGTMFKIKLELLNKSDKSDIYLLKAVVKNGLAAKEIVLYDDGSHGDGIAGDGIYSGIFDSSSNDEGIYSIDVLINSYESDPEKKAEFQNLSSFEIFRTNCKSLLYNGIPENKIDVVILPFGYTDLNKFEKDSMNLMNQGILSYDPFKNNSEKFNFYIVNQKGDFNCTKDSAIKSLVYCNNTEVEKFASQCPVDQIIVLLDDNNFCGSSSFYAKICDGWNFEQVGVHEFGHTFGGLGDEYLYASTYPTYKSIAFSYPNCDVAGCSKWKNLKNLSNVGCFKGCGASELYSPTKDKCIMKAYVSSFCPVCQAYLQRLLEKYSIKTAKANASLPAPVPTLDKTYLLDLNYDSGNLSFKNVYVTKTKAPDRRISARGDYTAKILSFSGSVLGSYSFDLPNIENVAPPRNDSEKAFSALILNKTEWTLFLQHSEKASQIAVYNKSRKLFSIDVGYLSNACGDGKCESHESNIDCPQDCRENIKDRICIPVSDGVCDPDCPPGFDTDCKEINWTFIAAALLITGLVVFVIIMIIAPKNKKT